jgi:hypothetical protein
MYIPAIEKEDRRPVLQSGPWLISSEFRMSRLRSKPFIQPFIHSTVRLATGPQPIPEPVFHRVRFSGSPFNFQLSLQSPSSCLRLLPPPVTSILATLSPSITSFRRQFLKQDVISPVTFHSSYEPNRHYQHESKTKANKQTKIRQSNKTLKTGVESTHDMLCHRADNVQKINRQLLQAF